MRCIYLAMFSCSSFEWQLAWKCSLIERIFLTICLEFMYFRNIVNHVLCTAISHRHTLGCFWLLWLTCIEHSIMQMLLMFSTGETAHCWTEHYSNDDSNYSHLQYWLSNSIFIPLSTSTVCHTWVMHLIEAGTKCPPLFCNIFWCIILKVTSVFWFKFHSCFSLRVQLAIYQNCNCIPLSIKS